MSSVLNIFINSLDLKTITRSVIEMLTVVFQIESQACNTIYSFSFKW